jgi:hypothetical protein
VPHILAADGQQIEAPGAVSVRVPRHEAAEVRDANGVTADELGVDDARRKTLQCIANDGKAPGDVLAVAAQDEGTIRAAVQLRPAIRRA